MRSAWWLLQRDLPTEWRLHQDEEEGEEQEKEESAHRRLSLR